MNEQRFWAKVDRRGPGECWTWQATQTNGYGQFKIDGKQRYAHRVSYELTVGPIPDGLQIDHLCRNRACVNPAHMEPVTPRVNTLRGIGGAAARAARTHCPRGHAYTAENTYRSRRNQRQ